MPQHTAILNSGGLRSLVAAATLGSAGRPTMIHVQDGRLSGTNRRRCFEKQAEHFEVRRRIELTMVHLRTGRDGEEQRAPMGRSQLLLAAAGEAIRHDAERLVWPVAIGERFDDLAAVTEAVVILEHAIKLETDRDLRIDMPLLDMTLRQVIELGAKMDVPWELAWSCQTAGRTACGGCAGCHERNRAFEAAGLDDPLLAGTGA